MKRTLTCIVCPLGCQLTVELENKTVRSVTGNTCPRGKAYAETECIAPMRTLTGTVLDERGAPLAVKTDRPIPKEALLECMKLLSSVTVSLPVSIGDVVLENVFGANVVATQNRA